MKTNQKSLPLKMKNQHKNKHQKTFMKNQIVICLLALKSQTRKSYIKIKNLDFSKDGTKMEDESIWKINKKMCFIIIV